MISSIVLFFKRDICGAGPAVETLGLVAPGAAAAAAAGAVAGAAVEGVGPVVAAGLAPKRPVAGAAPAVVAVGAAADVVAAAGLAPKRDPAAGAAAAGAAVDAGAAAEVVAAPPPKKPPALGAGAVAPPPKSEGVAVVVAAAAGAEEAGVGAAAVVAGAAGGFEAMAPPKRLPPGAGAAGFAPKSPPGAGAALAGAAAGSAGLAPKRPPAGAGGLFRPPKRDGAGALPAAGVPAGVVDEAKLNGLFGAGVVEPRVGAAAGAPAGLLAPPKRLAGAAGASGLLGVGKELLVGVELGGFCAVLWPKEKEDGCLLAWNPPPKSPPAGAAAGVAPALAPEVVAPNKPPEGAGAVVVVEDPNKPPDAGGFAAPPPNRFPGAVEAGVAPKENPPGFVVAAAPPPKRLPVGCLLSAVAPAAGWPKMLGEGAPDDAGVVDCPKRLPPVPPVAPKLKDILDEIRSLNSSRMAIQQELCRGRAYCHVFRLFRGRILQRTGSGVDAS